MHNTSSHIQAKIPENVFGVTSTNTIPLDACRYKGLVLNNPLLIQSEPVKIDSYFLPTSMNIYQPTFKVPSLALVLQAPILLK